MNPIFQFFGILPKFTGILDTFVVSNFVQEKQEIDLQMRFVISVVIDTYSLKPQVIELGGGHGDMDVIIIM